MTDSPASTPLLDRIDIEDLHLRCVIGIQAWERKVRQDVRINIALFAEIAQAGQSDNIDDTVNYKSLSKKIIAMTEASSFQLVEALAQRIAQITLDQDRRVKRVRVKVEKPGALRFARTVGVTIERHAAS
ncbi:MAG: dihydroneopterin aldolase [Magnetococcales bacterium]|nr:dihydroneopterin aldolase [Magnetococcales bacterium]